MPPVPRATPRPRRGSVLIVAMLLAAIIGVALVSYIQLTTNSLKMAQRNFLGTGAMNLAEVGLEEALYSFNQLDNTTVATAWSGWTLDNSVTPKTAKRTFTGFTPGQNATGLVKVYVEGYDGTSTNPVIVTQSIVTPDTGATISRYIKVTLKKRGLFTNGLVARTSISWVGHPTADSWNSDPDNNSATAAIPYSAGVQTANCPVACVNGDISLGSGGNVFGTAKTGSTGSTSGGSVHGLGTTTNDSSRITTDFSATFPAVTVPSPTTVNTVASGSVPTTFPLGTHNINTSDSRYYYNFGSGAAISATTTVSGNVTFIMTNHSGVDVISFTGSRSLTINTGASMILYTNGNIDVHGNGLVNNNQAAQNLIYGTNTTAGGQSITVGGNGQFIGAVYAPNASLTLQGGGSSGQVSGSFVGNTVSMNGGTDFHYDEALGNLVTGNPWGITNWRELTTADDRSSYTTQLASF